MDSEANSELPAALTGEPSAIAPAKTSGGLPLSAGSIIARRFVGCLVDASFVGAISAFTATILVMCVNGGFQPLSTTSANLFAISMLAFAIGFIDSFCACGWLVCLLGFLGLLSSLIGYCEWYVWLVPLLINHLYHIVYIASRQQATPGKRLMGLVVCGALGQQLLPHRLVLRQLLKFPSALLSCLPLVHMLTSKRSQLLHDVFVGSFILPKENPHVVPNDDGQLRPARAQVATIRRRIVASLLDSALFCALLQLLQAPIMLLLSRWLATSDFDQPMILMGILYVLFPAIASIIAVFVFAAFESSALQATPGKIVAGLKVTGQNGETVTFTQSLVKQFNQSLAYLSLYPILGLVWLVKLALPEAECVLSLIGFLVFYLAYGSILCITFRSGQTLLDRVCQRYVLLDSPACSDNLASSSERFLTDKWRLDN
jgi:uncharacterized RDD family membrane protein YckC